MSQATVLLRQILARLSPAQRKSLVDYISHATEVELRDLGIWIERRLAALCDTGAPS
jgi:hypothetical protein